MIAVAIPAGVIPRARDLGEPALRGFGQRAKQRDRPSWMRSTSERGRDLASWFGWRRVDHEYKSRDTDVGGRLPRVGRESGAPDPFQHLNTGRIVDRRQVEAARVAGGLVAKPPQRGRIPLDHLTNPVADGLQD